MNVTIIGHCEGVAHLAVRQFLTSVDKRVRFFHDGGVDNPDIATRLRYWREKAALSREELAAKVGVDSSAIRHWERGATTPRDLEAVVVACGIDMPRFWSPIKQRKAS